MVRRGGNTQPGPWMEPLTNLAPYGRESRKGTSPVRYGETPSGERTNHPNMLCTFGAMLAVHPYHADFT